MKSSLSVLTASLFAFALLPGLAAAQKKVPGEKWKQTSSMEMAGMSMPSRTSEVCVPIGRANESLYRSEDPNCSVYDTQVAGNKFTAKMRCTGTNAMEGTIESISEGNRTRGTMYAKSQGGEMTMKFDSTKLGTACEAIDYSDYKPPAVAAVPAADSDAVCKKYAGELDQDPAKAASYASLFAGGGASCAKSASRKSFCTAAQSHRGFLALDMQEKQMAKVTGGSAGSADDANIHPLSAAMGTCGVGSTPAAADALRKKLHTTAAAQNEWEFLLGEGDEADFKAVVALAKNECSGRGYTGASNPRYTRMCGAYGKMLVAGDRAGVMSVLSGECVGDCGSSGGASVAGSSADRGPNGAGQPNAAPAQDAAPEAAKEGKDKAAKDALDKGKKLLRGLLGGG